MSDAFSIRWIGVDWGTSRLRAWAMTADGVVLARSASNSGMGGLSRSDFEPALLALIGPWLADNKNIPVVCCGMVGSRQGWVEAPYRVAPTFPVAAGQMTYVEAQDQRISIHIIPGIAQHEPADVMRGEETQIAGLLAGEPDFSGVVCLPGTHTKWVRIKDKKICMFSTYLTGELFSLLAEKSVLRHPVGAGGWDGQAFRDALESSITEPEKVAEHLFSIRAQSLISDLSRMEARARLSGLLIGLELGGSKAYWDGRNVAVLGTDALAHIYHEALKLQGATCTGYDVEAMTLAGLRSAASQLLNAPYALEAARDG